jgi:hypothetical protein
MEIKKRPLMPIQKQIANRLSKEKAGGIKPAGAAIISMGSTGRCKVQMAPLPMLQQQQHPQT